MEKIFKYELQITDEQNIAMPSGSRILSVQEQSGNLCLWAVVEKKNTCRDRKIMIFGTGNPLPEGLRGFSYDAPSGYTADFIGTVQASNGLVWHVFSTFA